MVFYVIMMLLFLWLYFVSRKKNIPKEIIPKSPYHYFAKMAFWIYEKTEAVKKYLNHNKKGTLYLNHEYNVNDQLHSLYPGRDKGIEHAKYYMEKISLSLLIMFAGIFLGLMMSISASQSGKIKDGAINRKGYGKGDTKTTIVYENEAGEEEEIVVVVSDKDYTKEQVLAFYEECSKQLEEVVLNGNPSISQVTTDLYLPKKLKGYPFKISWHSNNYKVIKNSGEVITENLPEEGTVVMLEATLSYKEYEYIYEFGCVVYPKALSCAELYEKEVRNALKTADEKTDTEDKYYLPKTINGKPVTFREKVEDNGPKIMFFLIFIGILLYFVKDKDLTKKIEERKEEMMIDYPEIVSKITLLVGAGMTVRAAWKRIVIDYCKTVQTTGVKKYAYEEMLLAMREMEAGVSEIQAYDHFGKRCGLQQYVKFASLLSQNLRKGTAGFAQALEQEAQGALIERRTNARIKGEKAGTKLLVPMMIMLVIVLVMIIVPAFSSL